MFGGRVEEYWLPTTFSCFPYTSPLVRHRVPSDFNWALLMQAFVGLTSYFAAAEAGHTLVCVVFTNTAVIPRTVGPVHRCNLRIYSCELLEGPVAGVHFAFQRSSSGVNSFIEFIACSCCVADNTRTALSEELANLHVVREGHLDCT